MNKIPKELIFKIIRYHILFGDYNPDYHGDVYYEYIDRFTEWNK